MKLSAFAIPLILATAASAQQGFPFTSESLKYTIDYTSGLSLGEANFNASHSSAGWEFDASVNAAVPGFGILDNLRASANNDLCSTQFTRDLSNGRKKTREKTTFDEKTGKGHRITTLPSDGGETTFTIPSCPRDALTFVYYGRRELGQGRVPHTQDVYFGATYTAKMEYAGAQNLTLKGKPTVTDHVVISVKGPKSDFSFEVFYARDAARTPLQIRIPAPAGTLTAELVQ
jgi:Protein of unknown function (DUF3108)